MFPVLQEAGDHREELRSTAHGEQLPDCDTMIDKVKGLLEVDHSDHSQGLGLINAFQDEVDQLDEVVRCRAPSQVAILISIDTLFNIRHDPSG